MTAQGNALGKTPQQFPSPVKGDTKSTTSRENIFAAKGRKGRKERQPDR
jgi:hypothetical protein